MAAPTSLKVPALYVETSALMSALLEGNPSLREAFRTVPTRVTSRLTFTEAARSLRRAVHTGRISAAQRLALERQVRAFRATCDVLELKESVFQCAEDAFPVEHVATLDALHLASVLIYARDVGPVAMASQDERLRRNAVALGFAVLPAM